MKGSKERGAMYPLAHQKANELSAMKAISEEVVFRLVQLEDEEEQLAAVFPLLEARGIRMQAVDQLDKRMAFLEDSGYEPHADEARRIALEQGTMLALLRSIQALDAQGIKALEEAKERLTESMKEVRDGQRSIQAYAPLPEEEEGRQVDTLR